jgi:hypothetical protein
MRRNMMIAVVAALTFLGASRARADVAAAWVEGHGGMENGSADTRGSFGGLGYQLGARLLIFEGYLDHTGFGEGAAVTRGIFGLRGGFGSKDLRLVLRGGLGVIDEQGGALTGRLPGTPDRRGGVARAGVALESRLMPVLLAGFSLDGETFALAEPDAFGTSGTVEGSDVFASLHLTFELGI